MNKFSLGLLVGLAAAAGCRTPAPQAMTPITAAEARALLARSKDPRLFGVTVYSSDNGEVFANANRVGSGQYAILPFRSEEPSTAPLIRVAAHDAAPGLALIDTSAYNSWMNLATAQAAEITPLTADLEDRKLPVHVGDQIGGYLVTPDGLHFDQLLMSVPLLYVHAASGPLGPLGRRQEKPEPAVVIGCDLLRAFNYVQIDYPGRRVVLSTISEYFPEPARQLAALPLQDAGGVFAVRGMLDREEQLVILDTAGDFEVAMRTPPAAPLRQLRLGDLVFRQVTVVPARDLGLGLLNYPRIGRQLLSRFRITIDNKRRLVYFERPAE